MNNDLISRQAAIEAIDAVFPVDPMMSEYTRCKCSAIVKDGEWRANYCPDCGQAIDWSENNE